MKAALIKQPIQINPADVGLAHSGIIVVTGFQLMDVKTLLASSSHWIKILCYLSLSTLGIALLPSFREMRSKGRADYPRGDKLWIALKPDSISEDVVQESLTQTLLDWRGKIRLAGWTDVFVNIHLSSFGCPQSVGQSKKDDQEIRTAFWFKIPKRT